MDDTETLYDSAKALAMLPRPGANRILIISRLLCERKEIAELDLNPVRVYEHGLVAWDARVIWQGTPPATEQL